MRVQRLDGGHRLLQRCPDETHLHPQPIDWTNDERPWPGGSEPPFVSGFYFLLVVISANKVGAEHDPTHWRSCPAVTCDGVLAFLACGAKLTDLRVKAARLWLEKNANLDCPDGVP